MAEFRKNEDTGTDSPVFELCLCFACAASTIRVIGTRSQILTKIESNLQIKFHV